jgi:2-dehydro-3-deoxyphosphooctonate aldolase (KDO 8-P synthase)
MRLCGFDVGLDKRFFLIAGTCSIESLEMSLQVAGQLKEICMALGIPLIYKGSFDKANRSSGTTQRGLGMDAGLKILDEVRRQLNIPVLTDVHDGSQVQTVASVVDVLQTPAFLCRQTDFIRAVAQSGKPVNIKKGQFLAPWDMKNVIGKLLAAGNPNVMACERGASFGYNTLVSDMRALPIMAEIGCPVVFDATHSVQQPGGQGATSGGQRQYVPVLARAAVSIGVACVFVETHPDPDNAPSDGPNMVPMHQFEALMADLLRYDQLTKGW